MRTESWNRTSTTFVTDIQELFYLPVLELAGVRSRDNILASGTVARHQLVCRLVEAVYIQSKTVWVESLSNWAT